MRRLVVLLLIPALLFSGAGYWLYQRPIPQVRAEVIIPHTASTPAIQLPWPAYGQSALGAVGYGVLDTHNTDSAVPIASIAKAVTALAILKEKPLEPGQTGASITITEPDVRLFEDYLTRGGSVVPVAAGNIISQYDALLAMMLPSANNIADTAAIWAFGSLENYTEYANQFVKSLGMTQTNIADASGFSAQTTSTAKDLVLLAEAAMQNSLLASIVNQSEATFPGVGTIRNVNWLLKTDGVIGIKTGNTDEAGGCFLFGARRTVAGQPVIVIGAILGAPTRNQAMADSQSLIKASDSGFELVTVARVNQVVGNYKSPWGANAEAVVADELKALNWKGDSLSANTNLSDLKAPTNQGEKVGSVRVTTSADQEAPVKLKQPISGPSWTWRIFHW